MACGARAQSRDEHPERTSRVVTCALDPGHPGPHRAGPHHWTDFSEYESALAEERAQRQAAEAREFILREALASIEGLRRCTVCARNPAFHDGNVCSFECAELAGLPIPSFVHDAPTRAVSFSARDTLILDVIKEDQ